MNGGNAFGGGDGGKNYDGPFNSAADKGVPGSTKERPRNAADDFGAAANGNDSPGDNDWGQNNGGFGGVGFGGVNGNGGGGGGGGVNGGYKKRGQQAYGKAYSPKHGKFGGKSYEWDGTWGREKWADLN